MPRHVGRSNDETEPKERVRSLVEHLRLADRAALERFYLEFAPLLRSQTRRYQMPIEAAEDLVGSLLGDVAIQLVEGCIAPDDLHRYLVVAIRNRARNWARDQQRATTRIEAATMRTDVAGRLIVLESEQSS